MPAAVRRPLASMLLALLLAGCALPGAPPATTTPPAGQEPGTPLALVAIDGRWDFDARAALALLGLDGAGLAWVGEARVGDVAGTVVALDDAAARLLDAPVAARGQVLADASGPVTLEAAAWPAPKVTAAFEMERVRSCDAQQPAALCSEPSDGSGVARLRLETPPGASDLRFHADVLELTPKDYPAEWDGAFTSPDGQTFRFRTAARTRADVDPPGEIQGDVTPGTWTISFTLSLDGTPAPGAIAGFITYRTPGFAAYDLELLKQPTGELQTRAALAQATTRNATLDARAAPGALPLGAVAMLSPEDARGLLGVADGNATALVVANRAGLADLVRERASAAVDPALRALRVLPLRDAPAAPHPGASWARPEEAATLAARPVPGGGIRLNGTPLPAGTSLLGLPLGPAPWRILPGGHWSDAAAALQGLSEAPHLVVVSEDLARAAGLDPTAVRYAKLEVDAGLGARTLFVMGAVADGPPQTVWVSSALVAFVGKPTGGRALDGGVPVVG